MKIKGHMVISIFFVFPYVISSLFVFPRDLLFLGIIWISGWIMDVDHLFDLFISEKRLVLNTDEARSLHRRIDKLFVIFHSYELSIVMLLVLGFKPTTYCIIVNFLCHLLIDTVSNEVKPFTYFFLYRLVNRFKNEKFIIGKVNW